MMVGIAYGNIVLWVSIKSITVKIIMRQLVSCRLQGEMREIKYASAS